MPFNNISGLLERFKNLQPSDGYVKDAFITSVREVMHADVRKDEISVQRNTIFLSTHPAFKTEVYMHKKKLLESLEEKLQKKVITNII